MNGKQIIKYDKSVIPACDVENLGVLSHMVQETASVEGIGGYKIGLELALRYGLFEVVDTIRGHTDLPIIYDHQKAANDIPELGDRFAKVCRDAKVDAVILFPFTGPFTEKVWIHDCLEAKLGVIVGGEMTHKGFRQAEGGYFSDAACEQIYRIAVKEGVRDFVVPGNKPERIAFYREMLKHVEPVFYSPGLVAQGGKITDAARAAGDKWHAIVGRGIYESKNMNAAAKEFTQLLNSLR